MTLKEAIDREIEERIVFIKLCQVKDIDEAERTCTCSPVNGDADILEVRLQASMNSEKGFVLFPKKDSFVYVGFFNKHSGIVVLTDEIDKAEITIQNTTMVMDQDGVVFNGGDNKGMVILDKIIDRYNKIENDINSLKQVLSGWTPVPNDGGAALKLAAATWYGQQLQTTNASQIENDKVKH